MTAQTAHNLKKLAVLGGLRDSGAVVDKLTRDRRMPLLGFKKKEPPELHQIRIPKAVYDFEFCQTAEKLAICMASINANGYRLIAVTGNAMIGHTVFFSRFSYG